MYTCKLHSKYYKNILYSNFLDINFKWLFRNNNVFSTIMILLKWKPKNYNQKSFLISIMLIEFLLKGPFINVSLFKNSYIFIKSYISKKTIAVTYILKLQTAFIFLDSFLTNIYWAIYDKTHLLSKNQLEFNFNKLPSINYKISKILDITSFVRNKIQLESYFLRKTYSFQIFFPGMNLLYYLWWIRCFGFYKFI